MGSADDPYIFTEALGTKVFYDINLFLSYGFSPDGFQYPWGVLDCHTISKLIQNRTIGGLFGVPRRLHRTNISVLAPQEWYRTVIEQLNTLTDKLDVPPLLYAIHLPRASRFTQESTVLPQPIGLAATFNHTAAWISGRIVGTDARCAGVTMISSPLAQLALIPSWPGTYETFGESTFHVDIMTEQFVYGLQYHDTASKEPYLNVAANIGGFGGSNPRNGNYRANAWVPDNIYAQHYTSQFRTRPVPAEQNDAETLQKKYHFQTTSNMPINGVPASFSTKYLDAFRKFVGNVSEPQSFPSLVVSTDEVWKWVNEYHMVGDIATAASALLRLGLVDFVSVSSEHRRTVNMGDAFAAAYRELETIANQASAAHSVQQREGIFGRSGVDVGSNMYLHAVLEELDQVRRNIGALRERLSDVREMLGLSNASRQATDATTCEEKTQHFTQESYHLARQSVVLLENKLMPGGRKVLPLLDIHTQSVAVIGQGCDSLELMTGGIHRQDWIISGSNHSKTLFAELHSVAKSATFSVGCTDISDAFGAECDESSAADAVTAAQSADIAVMCVGETPYYGAHGDITDLWLPSDQIDLVERVTEVNQNTIVVLFQGRNRLLDTIPDVAAAVIHAFLPGPQGGRAVADIITGKYVPSGRLPLTYLRYPLPAGVQHWRTRGSDYSSLVQYPYGYGLSYSTFEYSNASGDFSGPQSMSIELAFDVKNTGAIEADHRVLCFNAIHQTVRSRVFQLLSAESLFDFHALRLKPGEIQRVNCSGKSPSVVKTNSLCEEFINDVFLMAESTGAGSTEENNSLISQYIAKPHASRPSCHLTQPARAWSGVIYSPRDAITAVATEFDFILPGLVCFGAGIVSAVTIISYCRRRAAQTASAKKRAASQERKKRRRRKEKQE